MCVSQCWHSTPPRCGPLVQVAARQVVDFDSLAFKQGGHFKSNKTTGLPEGSFRCAQAAL